MEPSLITFSAIRSFCDCRKAFRYRYINELVPIKNNHNLYYGSLIHNCLETWYKTQDPNKVFSYIKKTCVNNNESQTKLECLAMMQSYIKKYLLEKFVPVYLEKTFHGPILNTDNSILSEELAIGGKIDGLVKQNGDYYILEHKTTSLLNQGYIERLQNDFQILLYSHYISKFFKIPVKGIIYNILIKSRIKRNLGENQSKFEDRKKKSKSKRATITRKLPETDSSYISRLIEKYEQPYMFHRELIFLNRDKLKLLESHIWNVSKAIIHCFSTDEFYGNYSQCYYFNKPCQYYPLCFCNGDNNSLVIQNFYKKSPPHQEIPEIKDKYSPLSFLGLNTDKSE